MKPTLETITAKLDLILARQNAIMRAINAGNRKAGAAELRLPKPPAGQKR